jgi:hypothetical protein
VSRVFNGSSDVLTFAAGGSANLPTGALTIGFFMKIASSHRGGVFDGKDGSAVRQLGINPFDNAAGNIFFLLNGSVSQDYSTWIGKWTAVFFTKAAGSANVRVHYFVAGGSWQHIDLGVINVRSAITQFFVGSFDGGQFYNGKMAVLATWVGTELSDASIAASTVLTALSGWVNLVPTTLLAFNQAAVTDSVTCLMGSGANQSARTGTTVDGADDPPGFSYTLGPVTPVDTRVKVKRHVTYYKKTTVGGVANQIKLRPAIITGVAADGAPILRVKHTGEVYGNGTNGVPARVNATDFSVYTWL